MQVPKGKHAQNKCVQERLAAQRGLKPPTAEWVRAHRTRQQHFFREDEISLEIVVWVEHRRSDRPFMLHSGNGGRVLNHDQRSNEENATAKNFPVLSLRTLKEFF